jgi:tRNA(Ile)-lysidine synthase
MALGRALLAIKAEAGGAGRLIVGHVNHQLRGEESEGDQQFLTDECAKLEVELVVRHVDTAALAVEQGDGVEAAARSSRYRLLTEMAEQVGARFVATAHTRDDQAETVLFRLIRGTGLRGLAGIPFTRSLSEAVTVVRPMLGVRSADVKDYLTSIGQAWRTDKSNVDRRFKRNRIRHDILPQLGAALGGDAAEALARISEQAAVAQAIVEQAARDLLERCRQRTPSGGMQLDVGPLVSESPALVGEALRLAWREAGFPEQDMTRRWWEKLAALAQNGERATLHLPGGVLACKRDETLALERRGSTASELRQLAPKR